MSNTNRNINIASIAKTKIITDFGLATPIQEWISEGSGRNFNLITRRSDQTFNNTPVPNIVTIRKRYTITPGLDIYNAYFSTLGPVRFERATLSFSANTVFVNLNKEE